MCDIFNCLNISHTCYFSFIFSHSADLYPSLWQRKGFLLHILAINKVRKKTFKLFDFIIFHYFLIILEIPQLRSNHIPTILSSRFECENIIGLSLRTSFNFGCPQTFDSSFPSAPWKNRLLTKSVIPKLTTRWRTITATLTCELLSLMLSY